MEHALVIPIANEDSDNNSLNLMGIDSQTQSEDEPSPVNSPQSSQSPQFNSDGSTEVQDDSPIGKKRATTSVVWNHFKRVNLDGDWKAICNYCSQKLIGKCSDGTSHLRKHF